MKMSWLVARSFLGLVCISLFALACGDESSEGPVDTGPREGYPDGPYGVNEQDVIANLEFVDSEEHPFKLEDIYEDGANQVLLINTSAGWCTACIEEMPKLQNLYDTYHDRGLAILVALFEDADFQPVDGAYASSWKDRYDLTLTVVADPTFVLADYYNTDQTPMNMIVEVSTMKIVRITTGFDESGLESLIRRYTQ